MATPFQTYTIHYQSAPLIQAYVQIFNAGSWIGNLNFYTDGAALPANTLVGTTYNINYHLSRFRDVLQILEYEKPLSVYLGTDGTGMIMTSFEPVGEQEGV